MRYSFFVKAESVQVIKVLDEYIEYLNLNGEDTSRSLIIVEALTEFLKTRSDFEPVAMPKVTAEPRKQFRVKIPKKYYWFAELLARVVTIKKESGRKSRFQTELVTLALHGLTDSEYGESLRGMLRDSHR